METTTIKRNHCQHDSEIRIVRDSEGKPSRTIEGYAIRFNSPSVPFAEDERSRVIEYISPDSISEDFLRSQDIKMTIFHDMRRILGRAKRGAGSLEYTMDESGVKFRFNAPHTADGDMALELVERGDIDGCSFMFSTYYNDREFVSREIRDGEDGKKEIVYTVRKITGLYDFTLTPDPAYPETSVSAAKRDISELDKPEEEEDPEEQEPEEEQDPEEEKRESPFSMDDYMKLIKLSRI